MHELIGDLLTPCLLKHESIYTPPEVVNLDPANSIGSRIRRGNLTPSGAKFREGFTVLLLIFSCRHIAINSLVLGYVSNIHVLLRGVPGWLVLLRTRRERLLFADEPD